MADYRKHTLMLAALLTSILFPVAACKESPPAETTAKPPEEAPVGTAKDAPLPSYVPVEDPRVRGFETGPEYTVTGKITSDLEDPLPKAIVTSYVSPPRWSPPGFDQPAPLQMQICDEDGRYQLRLNEPANLWLSIRKEGYGHVWVFLPVRDPKLLSRDFELQTAQAAVSGSVLDKKDLPIAGAVVVANPLPFSLLADTVVLGPTGKTVDAGGRYLMEGLPSGDVSVMALVRGFGQQEQPGLLLPGQTAEVNFTMSPATPITFAVKNRRDQVIPYPIATVPGRISITGGDANGNVDLRMPPDNSPFECTVSADGYQSSTIQMDPRTPPAAVVLEDRPMFKGRVLADSGEAVGGAVVSLWGTGGPLGRFEGSARSDKMGRFAIPMSYPPAREIRINASGFLEQRFVPDSKRPVPAETVVRMRPVESGIFGRVIDYRGFPVKRFIVHLREQGASVKPEYQRAYIADNGRFAVTDVAPGTYTLIIQSVTSVSAEDVQILRQEGVQIRKGFFFGEFIAQFAKPKYVK